jgi:hypothetical protein
MKPIYDSAGKPQRLASHAAGAGHEPLLRATKLCPVPRAIPPVGRHAAVAEQELPKDRILRCVKAKSGHIIARWLASALPSPLEF